MATDQSKMEPWAEVGGSKVGGATTTYKPRGAYGSAIDIAFAMNRTVPRSYAAQTTAKQKALFDQHHRKAIWIGHRPIARK